MEPRETLKLTRDCPAILVPDGIEITLSADANFTIIQALGDTFTGITERGAMVRIAGLDADALGKPVPELAKVPSGPAPETAAELETMVWDRLATCYDPEIPASIVDLGLIYSLAFDRTQDGNWRVDVAMTLTAPGCGMGEILQIDARRKVAELPGVEQAEVHIVFDPPWSMDMMTEAARLQLGM